MFQKLIYRIFSGRHYWRVVSFDEIAELYASRLITVFAVNIVNMFAAVYLYKLGYSVIFIALLYAALYAAKVPFSILVAKYAAYFGPKHGILMANILRIPSLIAFALVPMVGDNALWFVLAFGIFQQMSSTFYDFCYMIDFSKVKHSEHAGKEIGTMQIVEKIAKIVSPLVGGAVAAIYGPQVTIILASILFAIAAFPLLRTIEPTRTHERIKIAGFPWQLSMPSLISQSVSGYDFVASGLTWTLFVTLFVFGSLGDSVYAALGGLASLGVLISMLAAWTFGQMVDRHRGGFLLSVGTVANVLIHLLRPFVSTGAGVVGVNIASETATSAYAMPFTRVMFDVADSSGYRITYLMFMQMTVNIGASLACLVLALGVFILGTREGMIAAFILAAMYELIMLVSRRAAN
ncbi:MAG: MFS transporter [Candidatus Saccharimonas sp.]